MTSRRPGTKDDSVDVWVVCQVFLPDPQSTSQLLSDVLAGLAAREYRITVLSAYPGTGGGEIAPRQEKWNGLTICRGGTGGDLKRGLARRAIAYFRYGVYIFLRLLRCPRGQRIFVVTDPPVAPTVG